MNVLVAEDLDRMRIRARNDRRSRGGDQIGELVSRGNRVNCLLGRP